MKAFILALFGLLALANAAPHYGHDNYFTGSKEPLRRSYSSCKVEWRTVKKAGYKEVTEYKEKTVYVNVCKYVYQTECKNVKVPKTVYVTECKKDLENKCTEQWICLDYPKPASLKQCYNKKWQATGDCKDIYVEHCKDVQKQIYEYKEKCEQKQVQKCEDVPKIVKEEIHKRVPTQIEGKIAFRICPGKLDHEYTPTEVRTTDFTETTLKPDIDYENEIGTVMQATEYDANTEKDPINTTLNPKILSEPDIDDGNDAEPVIATSEPEFDIENESIISTLETKPSLEIEYENETTLKPDIEDENEVEVPETTLNPKEPETTVKPDTVTEKPETDTIPEEPEIDTVTEDLETTLKPEEPKIDTVTEVSETTLKPEDSEIDFEKI